MSLLEYRRKRHFAQTPEPSAGGKPRRERMFVVQLHHASHRHYDFRLELDGVLKSWAVPKGPSFDPAVKRLAMEVEDHPLSYADFEGDIPKGNYGAGHVDIFDDGTWEPLGNAREDLRRGELKFTLHGDVLRGSWVLVRTRGQGKRNQWLLIKHQDAYAGPREANDFVDAATDRPIARAKRRRTWSAHREQTQEDRARPQPKKAGDRGAARDPGTSLKAAPKETIGNAAFAPELCRLAKTPPTGDGWLHEVKWDGYRILATVARGKVALWSRNGIAWTAKVPDIAQAIGTLGLRSARLDGEMIVLRDGRDDFNALQARLSNAGSRAPLIYMLFDLVHLDGRSLRALPLLERKTRLAGLLADRPHPVLRYSEHQIGDGKAAFAQAMKAGLEGIVSKRVDSPYTGSRNGDWVKVKARPSDEFVVIGYTEPRRSRTGVGALLLAQPDHGGLAYVGRVGTGFSTEQLGALRRELERFRVEAPHADIARMARSDQRLAIWVQPRLVVEAWYQGIGGQGLLRQVAFKALRPDKSLADLASRDAPVEEAMPRTSKKRVAPAATIPAGRKSGASARTVAKRPSATPVTATDTVTITHPEREVFPGTGIGKGEVAAYYRAVAPWLLREIAGRPLSVVRCPGGAGKPCFFQKHLAAGWGESVLGVPIRESGGTQDYLCIRDAQGLLELVQMNVLEMHPWGAKADDPEHADRIVLDLDPHPSVAWTRMRSAARDVRARLQAIGLDSFLRTSGGKGLHVVVPLDPPAPWDAVKRFAQAVSQALAAWKPAQYVSVAGEKNRKDRIFVDYLRNGRGATSVASYSLRARASAGVAMPLDWDELGRVKSGDAFTIRNAVAKIERRGADPWAAMGGVRQRLPG